MATRIEDVIRSNGLVAGDRMKNVVGEEIPDSIVLGERSFMYREAGDIFCFCSEGAITGDETHARLSEGQIKLMNSLITN